MWPTQLPVVTPAETPSGSASDAVRWWLPREVARFKDPDFTVERLVNCVNSDLAKGPGNSQNRTLTLVHKYREGQITKPTGATPLGTELVNACQALPHHIDDAQTRRPHN